MFMPVSEKISQLDLFLCQFFTAYFSLRVVAMVMTVKRISNEFLIGSLQRACIVRSSL